jgi:DnaJ-class molecular chaperone
VDVADHPFFRRQGRDLHVTVPIAVHEAALGAVIEVPTLGGTARVRLPRGTASGQQLRREGHGIPAVRPNETAGDLVVEVQIVLPASLDERSKDLLREFGQRNDITPVRHAVFGQRAPRTEGAVGK